MSQASVDVRQWGRTLAAFGVALLVLVIAVRVGPAEAAGAYNRLSCRPSRARPVPVVLLHGQASRVVPDTAGNTWSFVAQALVRAGYCVFAPNYGKYRGMWGNAPLETDGLQVRDYIARVLRATHTRTVSLVGHSLGGVVARYYLRFLGGARSVQDLVMLSTPNHGTRVRTTCPFVCPALSAGSAFLRRLNRGGELQTGVDYTVIQSRLDRGVVPSTSAFLHGTGRHLTNVLIQRGCPADQATHAGILFDPVALQWVKNALARKGPADPHLRPRC